MESKASAPRARPPYVTHSLTAPVVLGDKDNEARTRQFCASYVTDLAEIAAGSGGQDVCNELKVFSSMTKTRRMGRGSAKRGGTGQDVGHNYAFGNTEGKARYDNLGCKPRGRRCDGYFNHKTENEARRVLVTVTIRSCVLAPKLRL